MFESPCSSTELDAADFLSPSQPLPAIRTDPCPQCKKLIPFRPKQVQRKEDLIVCPNCQLPLLIVAGKYRLEKKIGEGGGGIVYQARHLHLEVDSVRAIKFLKPAFFQDEIARKRFHREIQITASVSQKNEHIVRLYDDFGEIPGVGYYYVMEFLEGKTLADYLMDKEVTPDISSVLNIFKQICMAVNAAHKVKIIHRDLKPENVFLLDRGTHIPFVKVMDFGIAHPMEQSNIRLTTQGALGTPAYMAPEQFTGQDIDERSDIYVMGSLLYEMLVDHPPFLAPEELEKINLYQLARAHLYKVPSLPTVLRPDRSISFALEGLVMKALQKEPSNRHQSVQEMLVELQHLQDQELSDSLLRRGQFNNYHQEQFNRSTSQNRAPSLFRSTQNFGSKSSEFLNLSIDSGLFEQETKSNPQKKQELCYTKQTPDPNIGLDAAFFEGAPTVAEESVSFKDYSTPEQKYGMSLPLNGSYMESQEYVKNQQHSFNNEVLSSTDSFTEISYNQVSTKFKNMDESRLRETGEHTSPLLRSHNPIVSRPTSPRVFQPSHQQRQTSQQEKPLAFSEQNSQSRLKFPLIGFIIGLLFSSFGLYAMMTSHQKGNKVVPQEKLPALQTQLEEPNHYPKKIEKKYLQKVSSKLRLARKGKKRTSVPTVSKRRRFKRRFKKERSRKLAVRLPLIQKKAIAKKIRAAPLTKGCPHDSSTHIWIRIQIRPKRARFSTNLSFSRLGQWYCAKKRKLSKKVYFKVTAPGYQPCIIRKNITKRHLRLQLLKDSLSNPLDPSIHYCYR